jgi:O-antigen/teichoic acid export membrane protein
MDIERTGSVVFISRLVSAGLAFTGTIYYARVLGPAILGTFFLMQSIIGFLSVPADLGVQKAAEKRISEGENKDKLYTSSIILLVVFFAIVSAPTIIFRGKINNFLGLPLFTELIAVLLVTVLYQLFISFLRGELKVARSAVIEAIQSASTLMTSVAFVAQGQEIYGLIYGLVVGKVMGVMLSLYITDLNICLPTYNDFKHIFSFSKYTMILKSSGLLFGWADTIMIGIFLTKSLVGVYEVAWRLSLLGIIASNSISRVVFPNYSNLLTKGNRKQVRDSIPKTIIYSIALPTGLFFGAVVLSKDVLEILYGSSFKTGWLVLIVLSAERIFQSLHDVFHNLTMAMDHPKVAFRITVLSVIINVVLNILLIPVIGIEGAAIAVLTSYLLSSIILYIHIKNHVSIELPVHRSLLMFSSASVMCVFVYIAKSTFQVDSIVRLMIAVIFGIIIFAVSIPLWGKFESQTQKTQ